MKRFLLLLTMVLAVMLCACGKESPAEDFTYEMDDGNIIITGYTGTDLEIYIPSKINDRPVTMIGEEAFEGYDMTHITIPDSVTEIDEFAFANCACLTSVKLSKNLEIIDKYAFTHCAALEKVTFPSTLQRIDEGAFSDCGLMKVSLPDSLQYLGTDAFADCGSLPSLRIPDNTEIQIFTSTQNAGYVGYVTFFSSPVGGSFTTTYYDSATDAATGNKDYKQLQTAIIVSEGSYAHLQVEGFAGYGLTITIE